VAGRALDDALDRRHFVTRLHDEVVWVRADPRVFGVWEPDRRGAGGICTLADVGVSFAACAEIVDFLVDRAENSLVVPEALPRELVHAAANSRLSNGESRKEAGMVNPAALANDGRLPRPVETRLRNDHIAAAARLNRFDRQIAVPFICECSDQRCEELIRLTLGEFHAARTESDYLVAPGHQVESARIVRVRHGLWLYHAEPGHARGA
jgi:hypothetical protein